MEPHDPFEEYAHEALDSLPSNLRDRMSNVGIVVEDEPPPGTRLLGLYQGIPRTAYGADLAAIPSKITIFRGPLVRSQRTDAGLRAAVIDTVHHEIAHHFGISDARLREIERERR